MQSLKNQKSVSTRIIATSQKGIHFLKIPMILRELGFQKSLKSLAPNQLIGSLAVFNKDTSNSQVWQVHS